MKRHAPATNPSLGRLARPGHRLDPPARRLLGRVLYEVQTVVARYPWPALPLARARRRGVVVGTDTDVVIEGFPRSANSFCVAAFAMAQRPQTVRIAHHVHAPAQVLAAVRRGIPSLVLVREPEESVLEYVIKKPNVTVAQALRGYVRFYTPLLRHRRGFVIGLFADITTDLGSVMQRLNRRFGTDFTPFEHTEEHARECLDEIDGYWRGVLGSGDLLEVAVGRPSEVRDRMKEAVRGEYLRAPARSRQRAQRLFDAFVSSARVEPEPGKTGGVAHPPRDGLARARKRAVYEVKTLVAQHPRLAIPVARRRHGVPVGPDTEIVIEGFPRSANTFVVAAFTQAQSRPVRVAGRVHAPGQVIAAAKAGIPAVVLIREPGEAVPSFLTRHPNLTMGQAFRGYLRFYRPLLRYRDRFVVATFAEATRDLGAVIRRSNRRFGTAFDEFEHTDANVERVWKAIDEDYAARVGAGAEFERIVARPSASRETTKVRMRRLYASPPYARLRTRAEAVYQALAGGPVPRGADRGP